MVCSESVLGSRDYLVLLQNCCSFVKRKTIMKGVLLVVWWFLRPTSVVYSAAPPQVKQKSSRCQTKLRAEGDLNMMRDFDALIFCGCRAQ